MATKKSGKKQSAKARKSSSRSRSSSSTSSGRTKDSKAAKAVKAKGGKAKVAKEKAAKAKTAKSKSKDASKTRRTAKSVKSAKKVKSKAKARSKRGRSASSRSSSSSADSSPARSASSSSSSSSSSAGSASVPKKAKSKQTDPVAKSQKARQQGGSKKAAKKRAASSGGGRNSAGHDPLGNAADIEHMASVVPPPAPPPSNPPKRGQSLISSACEVASPAQPSRGARGTSEQRGSIKSNGPLSSKRARKGAESSHSGSGSESTAPEKGAKLKSQQKKTKQRKHVTVGFGYGATRTSGAAAGVSQTKPGPSGKVGTKLVEWKDGPGSQVCVERIVMSLEDQVALYVRELEAERKKRRAAAAQSRRVKQVAAQRLERRDERIAELQTTLQSRSTQISMLTAVRESLLSSTVRLKRHVASLRGRVDALGEFDAAAAAGAAEGSGEVAADFPHRTSTPKRSALKPRHEQEAQAGTEAPAEAMSAEAASETRIDRGRLRASFAEGQALFDEVRIASHRNGGDRLWFVRPYMRVLCDSCGKRVPQAQGWLLSEPERSQFMQERFHCLPCCERLGLIAADGTLAGTLAEAAEITNASATAAAARAASAVAAAGAISAANTAPVAPAVVESVAASATVVECAVSGGGGTDSTEAGHALVEVNDSLEGGSHASVLSETTSPSLAGAVSAASREASDMDAAVSAVVVAASEAAADEASNGEQKLDSDAGAPDSREK